MDKESKVEDRLRDTSEKCFNAYEAWKENHKDGEARSNLQDSVHELRKVASRIEIEIAISERDEMTQKPIPIPPHRDSHTRAQGDDRGNRSGGHGNSHGSNESKPRQPRRRPPQKKPAAS